MPVQDTDLSSYDRKEEWITCSSCHGWMLPLGTYEIQKSSEAPGVGADASDFLLWGLWAPVYNFIYDLFTYESRKSKLAQLKRDVLPQFPDSFVCPRCLHVTRRGQRTA